MAFEQERRPGGNAFKKRKEAVKRDSLNLDIPQN